MDVKLSKTDKEVLLHLKSNQSVMPEASGQGANLTNKRYEASKEKLLKEGLLAPAKRNGVVITTVGETYLRKIETSTSK